MITRRRRQGSETEHQPLIESESVKPHVVKGPSQSALLFSGETINNSFEPSFYIVPPTYGDSYAFSSSVNTNQVNPSYIQPAQSDSETMALSHSASAPSLGLISPANSTSRDRTAEFLSAVKSFQSRPSNGLPNQLPPSRQLDPHRQRYSEFSRAAKYYLFKSSLYNQSFI